MSNEIKGAPIFSDRMPVYVVQRGGGRFVLETTFENDHLNLAGVVHGGLIAALLDMGLAGGAYADAEDPSAWYGVTVSMTVNFLRSVGSGRAVCEAEPSGGGNRTRHVEARLRDTADGLVATATGVVKIIERPGASAGSARQADEGGMRGLQS